MGAKGVFWRTVNYVRGKEVRARSDYTTISGLAAILSLKSLDACTRESAIGSLGKRMASGIAIGEAVLADCGLKNLTDALGAAIDMPGASVNQGVTDYILKEIFDPSASVAIKDLTDNGRKVAIAELAKRMASGAEMEVALLDKCGIENLANALKAAVNITGNHIDQRVVRYILENLYRPFSKVERQTRDGIYDAIVKVLDSEDKLLSFGEQLFSLSHFNRPSVTPLLNHPLAGKRLFLLVIMRGEYYDASNAFNRLNKGSLTDEEWLQIAEKGAFRLSDFEQLLDDPGVHEEIKKIAWSRMVKWVSERGASLTSRRLKAILDHVTLKGELTNRKYVFDKERGEIAIGWGSSEEHRDIAGNFIYKYSERKSELCGGFIKINLRDGKFIITISKYSAHYDAVKSPEEQRENRLAAEACLRKMLGDDASRVEFKVE